MTQYPQRQYGSDADGTLWPLRADGSLDKPEPQPQPSGPPTGTPEPLTPLRRPRRWPYVLAGLALLSLFGSIGYGASTDEYDDTPETSSEVVDAAYVQTLHDEGIMPDSEAKLIAMGKSVCQELDAGATPIAVSWSILDEGNLTAYQSGFLVGAAVAAYCPEYTADLGQVD